MKTSKSFLFVGAALLSGGFLFAQAPGRGGAPVGPTLSIIQQLAAAKASVPADVTSAANIAQSDLTAASLSLPVDAAQLRALADALGTAEYNLALARRTEFEAVQASLEKLTTEQAISAMGGGGGGRGGRGGGGGGSVDWEAAYDDHTGFVSLFDGETLNGWDGESDVWMVNDGSIHSDNVNNSSGQHHIHYVGAGHNLRDFDLKVEFKIVGGNGGIHYRSRLLNMAHSYDGQPRPMFAPETKADALGKPLPAGVTNLAEAQAAIPGLTGNPWQISGYQFDITGANTGSLYEGQGRGVVANSGEVVQFAPGGGRTIISQTSDIPYAQFGNPDGWNKAEIIARGNLLVHMLNGRVFMVAIDDDPERAALEGIISLQLEGTGQIWYRNIWLKNL